MASSSHEDLRFLKKLQCNLCNDSYKNPKYLNCSHSFCECCLLDFTKKNPGDITCPTCKVITEVSKDGGISNLQDNIIMASLTDVASLYRNKHVNCDNCNAGKIATMVCVECASYMCDGCYKAHQTMKILRDTHNTFNVSMLENVVKLQEFQRNRFSICPSHKEPMKLYCKTEKKQLCHTCSVSTTLSHKSHDVCSIHEQLDQLQAKLTANIEKHEIDSLIASENKKLEVIISLAKQATIKSLADIDNEEGKVIQTLKEKYNIMRKEIQDANQESIYICKSKMDKNQTLKTSVENRISEWEALRVIPISSGIEGAESLLLSISKIGETAVQKSLETDVKKLKCFQANTKNVAVNIGCVQNKYPKSSRQVERKCAKKSNIFLVKAANKAARVMKEPDAAGAVVNEPSDKTRAHYKDGRNVKVGDRVIRGLDWISSDEDGGAGNLGTVKEFHDWKILVWVKWDNNNEECNYQMGKNKYRLQLADL